MTLLSFLNKQEKWDKTEDGERIAAQIEKYGYMEALELKGNTLGVDASMPIARALEKHPELKRALWSDLFTGRLKQEIPVILKNMCGAMYRAGTLLTELDLSDNAIGPMGMPGIEEFLASEAAFNLEVLNLNNCGMGVAGCTVAKCLIECRRKSLESGKKFALKTLIIGRNRQENKGAMALSEAFKELGTLEEVVMPQNGIKAEGIIALANAFKHNKNLRIINMNDNTFGRRGALAMAKTLGKLTKLEVVNFGDCLCRRTGSIAICQQLRDSGSQMKELNLSGNEIDADTAKTLINTVSELKNLSKFNLDTNNFGGEFDDLSEFASEFKFVDLGEEDDDQGSLDGDEDEEEELESEPSSEEEEEQKTFEERPELELEEISDQEDSVSSANAETMLHSFLDNSTMKMFEKIEEERLKMIDYFDEDMRTTRNPTQVTAFLCALSFVAAEQSRNPAVLSRIIHFAEDVIREAYRIKMFPLNPISQIVNNLVGNTGVVKVENREKVNLSGLVILLNELLKKNLMREFSGTLKLIKNAEESIGVEESLMERFAKMTT